MEKKQQKKVAPAGDGRLRSHLCDVGTPTEVTRTAKDGPENRWWREQEAIYGAVLDHLHIFGG